MLWSVGGVPVCVRECEMGVTEQKDRGSGRFNEPLLKVQMRQAFDHAPPVQEFGEVLMRSVMTRIQTFEDKLICAC